MPAEPLSPELALVDPELGARARAALPDRMSAPPRPRPSSIAPSGSSAPSSQPTRAYPLWARMTAALWLVALGILIGGTAIPHAQDRPRVVPPQEDVTICERPQTPTTPPRVPIKPFGP